MLILHHSVVVGVSCQTFSLSKVDCLCSYNAKKGEATFVSFKFPLQLLCFNLFRLLLFIYLFFLTCQLAIELSATDIYQEIIEVQTFKYDMVQETVFFCPVGNSQALPLCQVVCLLQVCVGWPIHKFWRNKISYQMGSAWSPKLYTFLLQVWCLGLW